MRYITVFLSFTMIMLLSCKKDVIEGKKIKSIKIVTENDEVAQFHTIQLSAKITLESGEIIENGSVVWSCSDESIAGIDSTGKLFAYLEGITEISATTQEVSSSISVKVLPNTVVEEIIPGYLKTPAEGYKELINVIVLRFLPTKDGKNIDIAQATDFWELGEISLNQLKMNINRYDKRAKFMLEEGSKFRGYKDINATPYLGYSVLKYITVYEQIPSSNTRIGGDIRYQPDYKSVFNRFNLNNFINENSIEEVWLWYGEPAGENFPSYDPDIHGNIEKPVGFVESNMSSPTTGDISNSYRIQDDLPILDHTYVVYCYNFRRSQAEMVHNHGHQLESIYKYAATKQDGNFDLFISNFCGWGTNYSTPPIGRVGDCHHPPNTSQDYDYLNTTLVESDIEDWKPDNSGEKKMVNVSTWGNLVYNWPDETDFNQRKESQWYIYWMQNMPGYQNTIPYSSGKNMTNWWIFTADWDNAINSNLGLHE